MSIYAYKALQADGRSTKGTVDADSLAAAKKRLKSEGLFVTTINELSMKARKKTSLTEFFVREKTAQLAMFSRQLTTLLKAGMPLLRAFTAMMEQLEPGQMKEIISSVRESVREGDSLADALRKFPAMFPELMINMIEAGESSGALDLTLARLADYYEGKVRLRNQLRATLAYPVFMVCVGIAVLFFLFVFLIPRITAIFDQMHTALPLMTRLLISFSVGFQQHWYLVIVVLFFVLAGLYSIRQREDWLRWIDEKKLRLPLIGTLLTKLAVARFARTLGTLLMGGVSIFQALEIVKTIMNNRFLADHVEQVRTSVGEGASLTARLRETGVFPPVFLHMIGVGEETGQLETMMVHVAETFELEVDQTVTAMTSLLEPIMILAMGLIVGTIVIAVLLPIFEMSQIIR